MAFLLEAKIQEVILEFDGIFLITGRFLVIFLVVSRKKRNFGGRVKRLKGEDYGIRDKKHSCFDR